MEMIAYMIWIEAIGVLASTLIFISMCVQSHTIRGNIIMRIINTIGSLIFIWYGFTVHAWSTGILNIGATIINIVYIIKISNKK